MAQIFQAEKNEVVASEFSDAHLIERRQQMVRRGELASGQRGHVDIASGPMIESLMHVEMAGDGRKLCQVGTIEPLTLRSKANHFDKHGSAFQDG